MVHYTDRVDASQLCGENSSWKQVTKLFSASAHRNFLLEMFLAAIVL